MLHNEGASYVLVVTAVEAERDAVVRGLLKACPKETCGEAEGPLRRVGRYIVVAGGVGPAAAAASTALAIAGGPALRHVVSAGIGGGFPGAAPIGSVVVATEIVSADLGAETAQGFACVDELGFGSWRVRTDSGRAEALAAALRQDGVIASAAPVLTLSTVTGSTETAAELLRRVPGAAAEAMEGYGAALAASMQGIEAMEIRAISNAVGPRDRDAWRIGDALASLERAAAILPEVLNIR
ncbi:futalosine hydrolase [Paenibacillus albicereus]|uniref:futalosine hydrolase n=1 Tax=Paenibacillus albicereus TaxID=2726185 RepID=UPI00197E348F|nr:futalosine hydrolase [Paenibacillus albicereus]